MRTDLSNFIRQGIGASPLSVFAFQAEETISGFVGMAEAGEYVLTDKIGTIYRLDSLLNLQLISRFSDPLRLLEWSATGQLGVGLHGKRNLYGINAELKIIWAVELPFICQQVAVNPYGTYIVVTGAEGGGVILNLQGKKHAEFESARPLVHVEFLYDQPAFIGSADHGLLAAYDISGKTIWTQPLWMSISDFSLLQQAGLIALAAQNQGVHVYNGRGESAATLMLEGTASRISCSYDGQQVLVATIENHLYRINREGEILWAGETLQPVQRLFSDPLGQFATIAFDDRSVLRLEW